MRISRIEFENYKAFPKKEIFDIKPITLLIGKNSAGKSAIARLPILLSNSLRNNSKAPIELVFDNFDFGNNFEEISFGQSPVSSIRFKIYLENKIPEDKIEIEIEIASQSNKITQIVNHFKISSKKLNLEIKNPEQNNKYWLEGDISGNFNVAFKGMIPNSIREETGSLRLVKEIYELNQKINNIFETIDYVGPFRKEPSRTYSYTSSQTPSKVGVKGENAYTILGIENVINKSNSQLVKNVGRWFGDSLGGWNLDVVENGHYFEIKLINPKNRVGVNLVDVGHGMSQVLPLVVRGLLDSGTEEIALAILEQPELHLHPAAHGNLAELFAKSAKKTGVNYIIETHSENLLLRLRTLVADPDVNLSKDDIIIYSVEDTGYGSTLKKITVDEYGELSYWPEGVFSEGFDELVSMGEAQDKRENK